MINLISFNNIIEFHPKIVPGLSRAETKTNLASFWNVDVLIEAIIQQEALAFYQEESGYAGVFYFGSTPLCRTLNFFWSGKDPENDHPVNYAEVDEFLTKVALHSKCKFISCEGRKGWKPILSPLGYTEDSVIYTKEVSHELHLLQPVSPSGT